MKNLTHRWSRRRWLGGVSLAAGSFLLPLGDRLFAEEARNAPKRVVFVIEGNGWYGATPTVEGDRITALSSSMASLEPYLDQMSIASGLLHLDGGEHSHRYAALNGLRNVGGKESGGPAAATIDQEIAAVVGNATPSRSLQYAGNESLTMDSSILATGRLERLPAIGDPDSALRSTFGLAFADGESLDQISYRRAMLDSIREDLGRMRSRLGAGPEREKLQGALHQVELFGQRMDYMGSNAAELVACRDQVPGFNVPADLQPNSVESRSIRFFDLAAQSIICGLTSVLTMYFAAGPSHGVAYSGLGFTVSKHGLGHGGVDPVMGRQDVIHDFYAKLVAGLCDRLSAVPEGDGTMLDNTLIVWFNENGTAHHFKQGTHPFLGVLIGGRNFGLKQGGRFYDYDMDRAWVDFLRTVGVALGVPLDEFGTGGTAPAQGPLEELLV